VSLDLKPAVDKILSMSPKRPRIGLVLGSGLGPVVDAIENQIVLDYNQIPGFKKTSVEGHSGSLIRGTISGVEVAVMQGRVHFYEGHTLDEVVFPALMKWSFLLE